jgi:hypothetical protein
VKIGLLTKLTCLILPALLLIVGSVRAQSTYNFSSQSSTLGLEIDVLFDARLDRAVTYTGWVYEWSSSYIAGYSIGLRVLQSITRAPSGWKDNFEAPLNDYYKEQIKKRVTHPEQESSNLVEILDRHIAGRLFLAARSAAYTACLSNVGTNCRDDKLHAFDSIAIDIMTQRRSPEMRAAQYSYFFAMLDTDAIDTLYWFRAIRPLASRTIIFVLRITELASIGFLVSAFLRQLMLPTFWPTNVLIALVIAWGLDYLVHDFDRQLNQEAFQAKFEVLIDGPRQRVLIFVENNIHHAEQIFFERVAKEVSP